MNRVDIRNRVREITELTSDDVSDTVIDLYARDGFERIINLERRWPFYETSTTLTTVASTQAYSVTGISATMREVVSLRESTRGEVLDLVGHNTAEDVWGPTETGRPIAYSKWADSLYLWPTPSAAYTYTVRGYRQPTSWWESDAAEIDADERLHTAVVYFVISRLYQLQEDAEMSAFYAQTFAEAVTSAHREIMRPDSSRPLTLSSGIRGVRGRSWRSRLAL